MFSRFSPEEIKKQEQYAKGRTDGVLQSVFSDRPKCKVVKPISSPIDNNIGRRDDMYTFLGRLKLDGFLYNGYYMFQADTGHVHLYWPYSVPRGIAMDVGNGSFSQQEIVNFVGDRYVSKVDIAVGSFTDQALRHALIGMKLI